MNKYSLKHVGNTYISCEGYTLEVIAGGSTSGKCTIQIDGKITKEVEHYDAKRGLVKNPLHRTVLGVGYIGIGNFSKKATPIVYQLWQSMLTRVHGNPIRESYKDVKISDEWYNLQAFGEWFTSSNYEQGWQLDKDLLSPKGYKLYSKDTCIFLPVELNSLLANETTKNSTGFPGVSVRPNNRFKASIGKYGKYIGTYDTAEEAFSGYVKARKLLVKELTMKYKLPNIALAELQALNA